MMVADKPRVAERDTDAAGVHILDEARSPTEAIIWTMLCGAQCVALDNGDLIPTDLDFYLEQDGAKATCKRCLARRVTS